MNKREHLGTLVNILLQLNHQHLPDSLQGSPIGEIEVFEIQDLLGKKRHWRDDVGNYLVNVSVLIVPDPEGLTWVERISLLFLENLDVLEDSVRNFPGDGQMVHPLVEKQIRPNWVFIE